MDDIWPADFAGFVMSKGQRFVFVEVEPYVRKDGSRTELFTWESHCADCGAIFRFKTPKPELSEPNRRCSDHRKPGVRVR